MDGPPQDPASTCPSTTPGAANDTTTSTMACLTSAELSHVKVSLQSDMEDYRRRFHLEPIVKSTEDEELTKGRKRATVDEPCPKCQHPVLEFYTMQLRSADEGQTVFYECPNCGHKYSQNN